MTFFTEELKARVRQGTNSVIDRYCDLYPEVYDNKSHFVRVAIEKELRFNRKHGRYVAEGDGRV
jgi:hypothetical protein